MAKTIGLVCFLCLLLLSLGCSDNEGDGNTELGPSLAPTGPEMMGLVDGRVLDYLLVDTNITWLPSYRVWQDTGTQVIRMSGSGVDWVVKNDTLPIINLKISDPYVLQNGYWRKIGESDAIVYFPTPSITMDRSAALNEPWDSYTGFYTSDAGNQRWYMYFAYFGFYYTKMYAGKEQVFVPAYGGTTYRYEVKLFGAEGDYAPIATIVENYAPGIGLVRQHFRAASLIRVLSLRSYK